MSLMRASAGFKDPRLGAVITIGSEESARRYGVPIGTEVDLGMISHGYTNPLRRFHFWACKKLGRKVRMR